MTAYYNEIDAQAAEWLRQLIRAGEIPDGIVDERSIEDVLPAELSEFAQCHFFAGIGGWSLALRLAGWPDDRPVWTGSCPCQPFSTAGKRGGTADERHLWPAWFHLIGECRPPVVFGEQVASKDGLGWLDLVSADLEGAGYAVGAADLCAAGIGAPHIRQRLWFVGTRLGGAERHGQHGRWHAGAGWRDELPDGSGLGGLANRDDAGLEGRGQPGRERAAERVAGPGGLAGRVADAKGPEQRGGAQPGNRHGELGSSGAGDDATGRLRRAGGLADASSEHLRRGRGEGTGPQSAPESATRERQRGRNDGGARSADGGLEHARSVGRERGQAPAPGHDDDGSAPRGAEGQHGTGLAGPHRLHQDGARPTNGHWRAADWLLCRDGKWRPVEPGTFPLVAGLPGRVGLLRGYGNAIVPAVAAAFIGAVM